MRTDTIVRRDGVQALIDTLGEVDAERFIACTKNKQECPRLCKFFKSSVMRIAKVKKSPRGDGVVSA